ncbi:MAG: HD-GYP domain-containing protein [Planctomycetota bacterium]
MRELKVADLKPIQKLPGSLLHRSGALILQNGTALSATGITVMQKLGVEEVYLLEGEERYEEVRQTLVNAPIEVSSLQPGEKLARPLYDPRGALLLEAEKVIPKTLAASLTRRGISTIYSRRPDEELKLDQGKTLREALERLARQASSIQAKPEPKAFDESTVEAVQSIKIKTALPQDLAPRNVQRQLDRMSFESFAPEGEAFEDQVRDTRKAGPVSDEEKKAYTNTVRECLVSIRRFFADLSEGGRRIPLAPLEKVVNSILAGLIHNRDLLTLCTVTSDTHDYLVKHSLATAVLSINIGSAMGYGPGQVKSLAYGATMADAGLLRVPKQILDKREKLTPREYAEIRRHPALGLDMLQRVNGIPVEVPYIVYQSHERPNGTGYPRGKKDLVIHPFAKIVNAADTFTAMCSERPYRSSHSAYKAMERIVFMTSKRLLNADITRSFLKVNSLFPVGSFVQLSDSRIGRVVAPNPDDYMRPVVRAIWQDGFQPLPDLQDADLLEMKDLSIASVIESADLPPDVDPLIGF